LTTRTEDSQQLITFLRGLRAIRQFRSDPIPDEVIDGILEVVRWSGSASNRQHWKLIIVRDRETLQKLASFEGFAHHLAGASVGMVLVMAGDPTLVEQEVYDEGRLSERIMLAALAYGVGSCIGWLKGQGSDDAKALLGIPAQQRVRTVISLGYPDEEAIRARPKRKDARKPLSEIVLYERYSS
jgi:nitroreductase